MSAPKHMPGPWFVDADGCLSAADGGGVGHCLIVRERGGSGVGLSWRNDADKTLCAAAPDLLAACEELVLVAESQGIDEDDIKTIATARAAIAKAKGET